MTTTNLSDVELKGLVATGGWIVRREAEDELAYRAEIAKRRGVEIGETIKFVRHGAAPKAGKSENHRDGFTEDGVSVYLLDGEEVAYVGFHFDIATRPAYKGTGVVTGWGSDGEPLVRVISIRRSKKFDRGE